MKKIFAVVLALVLCLSVFACAASADVSNVKLGVILLHDEDSTYDLNFINGVYEAVESLGLTEDQLIIKRNIPESNECYEAALDLGATPGYALWHVLIPECKQGIVTGALLAFTLSLDDFTISYFTTSPLVQNLSTLIYSATKLGISPVYYALSSLMFVVLLVLLMIVNHRTADNN